MSLILVHVVDIYRVDTNGAPYQRVGSLSICGDGADMPIRRHT